MPEFLKVAKAGEIAPGEAKAVDVGARRIELFNIDGAYHAIDDTCTHRGGPLSEGMVEGTEGFNRGGCLGPSVSRLRVAMETEHPEPCWPGLRFRPWERLWLGSVVAAGLEPADARAGCAPELCRRGRRCAAVARGTD